MCLSTSKRSTTSAGVPGRPRLRLCGRRWARPSQTAATICGSPSSWSACFIHASCRSFTSSAISPSPKLRCARCVLITLGPRATRRSVVPPQQSMVEFANLFEGLSQLVVVAQPATHFLDLFAAQAELAGGGAGLGDSQNRKRVSAAAGADRAAAAVAYCPLNQRTTQDLSRHR